jgi:threonine dehydratase
VSLPVSVTELEQARQRLADPIREGAIHETPVVESEPISRATGGRVHLKLENLQRTGSFKVRGAYNKIAALGDEQCSRGVIAASAGNHAQGVALAAQRLGVDATICMPEDAPISKIQATRNLGAKVVLEGEDYNEAYDRAREIEIQKGRAFVHPYDDPHVIAGQATVGTELVGELGQLDAVLVCVGGGGLLAGVATAVHHHAPDTDVVAVEPTGADALTRSLAAGQRVTLDSVDTIADGLATRSCGKLPFAIAQQLVDVAVTVDDDAIARAILHLLESEKSVVEGAGAAATAALLEDKVDVEDREVAVTVSGGNIDVTLLANVIDRGLARSGRSLEIEVPLKDRPGSLHDVLGIIAETRANIEEIEHSRRRLDVAVNQAVVRIEMETRGPDHVDELLTRLEDAGYKVEVVD